MDKEGKNVSDTIKNNKELMIKLTSAGLLIATAKKKLDNYLLNHAKVFQEMQEDEATMAFFDLYYEENEQELKKAAAESLLTSNEAEITISRWRDQDHEFKG